MDNELDTENQETDIVVTKNINGPKNDLEAGTSLQARLEQRAFYLGTVVGWVAHVQFGSLKKLPDKKNQILFFYQRL